MRAPLPMVLLILTVLLPLGCLVAQAQDSGQGLVMGQCLRCHNAKRICKALGVKEKLAWSNTVTSMVDRGAVLSPAEREIATTYLAGLEPGFKPLCGN